MVVIRALISSESFHLSETVCRSKKKKTEAANMAMVPMKKVNPTRSPCLNAADANMYFPPFAREGVCLGVDTWR